VTPDQISTSDDASFCTSARFFSCGRATAAGWYQCATFSGRWCSAFFCVHFLEIAPFAVAITAVFGLGIDSAAGALDLGHFDALYYSASYCTTTGGPPLPTVPLRLLTVAETLTGVI
jgi:hypothetical protein